MKALKSTLLLIALSLPVSLWAAPQITLQTTTEKEISTVDERGQAQTERVPATDIEPGQQLFITLSFENTGTEAATGVQLDNPVPNGTQLVADSIWGDNATITFSVDNGTSYALPAELQVPDRAAGGQAQRPAQPADYTHIRWEIRQILPGTSGTVGFSALVQ